MEIFSKYVTEILSEYVTEILLDFLPVTQKVKRTCCISVSLNSIGHINSLLDLFNKDSSSKYIDTYVYTNSESMR